MMTESDYQRFIAGMSPEQAARFDALNSTKQKLKVERKSHGVYRSKLEADYADFLAAGVAMAHISHWTYEFDTFDLPGGYKYRPDFFVRWWWHDQKIEVYTEVKGYMRRHERLLLAIASEEAERRTGYPMVVVDRRGGRWRHRCFRKGMRHNESK